MAMREKWCPRLQHSVFHQETRRKLSEITRAPRNPCSRPRSYVRAHQMEREKGRKERGNTAVINLLVPAAIKFHRCG